MAVARVLSNPTDVGQPGVRMQVEPASQAGGTTWLPADLLKEQSVRIQLLNTVGVLLWTANLVMDLVLAPHGDRGPYRYLIEGTGAVLAAIVATYARFGRSSERVKGDLGVALIVPHAFALALLNSWPEQPTTMRPLSGVTVLILLFGMLAPARPGKILLAALVAASMDPLGVWIAHLRGLPVPSPFATFLMFYPNYVCAVLAVAPARVLYRLGRSLREARSLGSYQLEERLGSGGMGEVWRAHHHLLARRAAIKLIRPDMLGVGDDAVVSVSRFEREAQATAALTSPHTINVFDFGLTDQNTFYYAMELLNGRDLESLVREFGPLPPARAMHFVRQICCSLAEAHAMGLVHRDVKPANIYVCRMGLEHDFVKVLDFGLVKHRDLTQASTSLTLAPVPMGTPAYIAPEVILGETDVDGRVDVYAVGCVLYFLLTGETVFGAATGMKLLMQHVQDTPVPPSTRAKQFIPREIDELVLACLHKDPQDRPRDGEALLQLVNSCGSIDDWDAQAAKAWWHTHLPQLSGPLSVPERISV